MSCAFASVRESFPPSLSSPLLTNIAGANHGFFTRIGGVSAGDYSSLNCSPGSGDAPASVEENRARVLGALEGSCLVTNQQVHGNRVRVIEDQSNCSQPAEADGIVTAIPGVCLGALGADCAPVLFADGKAAVIGVAHAGWQGALAGVTDSVIDAMVGLGASEDRIVAAIGPAIQLASYEVGHAFQVQFARQDTVAPTDCFSTAGAGGKPHFDLPGYIRLRLCRRGLRGIDCSEADTYEDATRFFSYRRTCHRGEDRYGRQIGAICLSTE